nr:ABC transporter permease [Aeromonas taiwanensis]
MSISRRRLLALCRKESLQIVRDPSSILVAFIMPVVLLVVMGYAINLDVDHLRLGVWRADGGAPAIRFEQALRGSTALEVHGDASKEALLGSLARGEIRGLLVIDEGFSRALAGQGGSAPRIALLTDGSEPNTANFVTNYVQGIWQGWLLTEGKPRSQPVELRTRAWFNPALVSRNFLVPGSIAVVMTIIGALLTSLVVAREWERGTMEALLATPVTKAELLLSKLIPYYGLGIAAMFICLLFSVVVMGVPWRGSLAVLFLVTSLFLGSALGLGLFLSTVMRSQFNAAQAALTAAFLPAMMLSGFVFEIASMPPLLRAITHLIPARYFASSLQTLYQAGNVLSILLVNALCLLLLAAFWLALTARKTRRTLE